jgi:hypothetical protein
MLISRVQQPRRMQTIHELAQPIETCHNWQRIPEREGILRPGDDWSSRPPSVR